MREETLRDLGRAWRVDVAGKRLRREIGHAGIGFDIQERA